MYFKKNILKEVSILYQINKLAVSNAKLDHHRF